MNQTIADSYRVDGKREAPVLLLQEKFGQLPGSIAAKIEATNDSEKLNSWVKATAKARRLSDIPFDTDN